MPLTILAGIRAGLWAENLVQGWDLAFVLGEQAHGYDRLEDSAL